MDMDGSMMGRRGKKVLLVGTVILLVLIVVSIAIVVLLQEDEDQPDPERMILRMASKDAIDATLRHLTSEPHTAGTEADTQQAEWVKGQWEDQGLDEVHLVPYTVMLSYPLKNKNNTVSLVDGEGHTLWTSRGRQQPLWQGEDHPEVLPNFNAYSAPGNLQGDVVYAYLGRDEDFQYLESRNVSVTGRIILIRYGTIFRGNKVQNAERRGASAVLLFLDPKIVSPDGEGANVTYPNTVFAPEHAVQLGTLLSTDGDPVTPFFPSTDSAFRIPEAEAPVPKIPVQPISYHDAGYILSHMGGETAPQDWQGGLNLTYRLGPGLQDPTWNTSLDVYTRNVNATVYNVIGTIKGSVEADRYVLLGNHRDAWIFGGVDPSSATAALLEVSRVFGLMLKDGWRPRRTLVFCSWAAEEYGLVGSSEWTEQFTTHLKGRALAYLNVDMVFEGTYSFISKSSPLLYEAVMTATKKVANPDPKEVAAGRLYLYDTWLHRHPDPNHEGRPRFEGLGSGSDFSTFQNVLGIPSMDMYYTAEPDAPALPLYHTLYEGYHLSKDLYDPEMSYHLAITQTWALIALSFAQDTVVPLCLGCYGEFVSEALQDLKDEYGELLNQVKPQLEYFEDAVTIFHSATEKWTSLLPLLDTTNPLEVRSVNDAQMMLDRAFIDPHGLPGRPHRNHVVMAPSSNNIYNSDRFAGLQDLLYDLEDLTPEMQVTRWRQVKEHLAAITHLTLAAANVLTHDLW